MTNGNLVQHPRSRVKALLVVIGFMIAACSSAQAQETQTQPILDQSLTAQERKDLLARLSDAQVRDLVWNLIETESSPTDKGASGIAKELDDISARIRQNVEQLSAVSARLSTIPSVVLKAMTPPGRQPGIVSWIALAITLMIAAGWVVQRVLVRSTRSIQEALNQAQGQNFPQRVGRRFVLFLYDLVAPIAFAITTYIGFQILYEGHEPNRLLALGLISGIVTAMILVRLVNLVFSPHRPQMRLNTLDDLDSKRLSRSVNTVLILGTAMFYFSGYLSTIMPGSDGAALVGLLNLLDIVVLMALIIVFMWRVKAPVAQLIEAGQNPGIARKLFASIWPAIGNAFVLLLLAIGVVSALGLGQKGVFEDLMETLLLLLIITPLSLGLVGPLIREWGKTEDSANLPTQRDGLVKLARISVLFLATLSLGSIWDVNIIAIMRSNLGETISQAGAQIIVTVIVANLAWSATKRWVNAQKESDESGELEDQTEAGGDPGGQGLTRIATILPLLRGTLLAVIVTVAIMVSLSSLGVDTAPLIAAASVFGLAIGFGAQTLVADIISGIFFLVDDAFRKGEYIDIGGNTGTVEKISLRSMQLRHHNGPVHTIPYSQIRTLTNFSRDWVIMKFELRIPFEENVEKVRKLIKKVGQKLLEDPEHGPEFLEPLKSQGVNRMDDSAFVVRCKFSTKPGKQWAIRRIAYAAIQDAFAEAGIKFAPKRVVVEAVTPEIAAAGAAAHLSQEDPSNAGASR
ncbi:MAG: mechanosensitive ion channel family protein [Gammaproteobacteria bacterium]|nr:mechanosensitive ion channel family protein [Gammaproteobacteria bacterium]NDG44227.1 mechanosensitive ion channel family protein [Gammaproteobacteria bacterium]